MSNHETPFMHDQRFLNAFHMGKKGVDINLDNYFRAYTCCWAAENALNLPGDLVECGVWKGFYL